MTRTYTREDLDLAEQSWAGYSAEWRDVRDRAAARGILFPPAGAPFDSWEDEPLTQRAMVGRAMSETPDLLVEAIDHSSSWFDVIAIINRWRDDRRRAADQEDDAARRRVHRLDESRQVLP